MTGLAGVHSRRRKRFGLRGDEGSALVIVLLTAGLAGALGAFLSLAAITDTRMAAHVRDGIEAQHAADAGLERAVADLGTIADWDAVLAGTATSSFTDGTPGPRRLASGQDIDLMTLTSVLRCGTVTACTEARMEAATAGRPWGANNPRWQPFAHGPIQDLSVSVNTDSRAYIVVWVADDAAENDGLPLVDGGPPARLDAGTLDNPGRGTLALVVMAFGPGQARRRLDATVRRVTGPVSGVRILSRRPWP